MEKFVFPTHFDLHGRFAVLVDDFEGKMLDVLLDGVFVETTTDETSTVNDEIRSRYLISKTVFSGFDAIWAFAASPTNRSSGVKAT